MKKNYLLLPILLALIWTLLVPNEPISDSFIYDHRARAIADGKGYVDESGNLTAYWAPGYAFYVGVFYWVFGKHYMAAFFANFLSYLFLAAGGLRFGKALYSERIGILAALCLLCYPTFFLYNTVIASEVLFSALLIWALFFSWRAFEKGAFLIPAGILFGVSALVRPQALILPFVLLVMGRVRRCGWRKSLACFCIAMVIMMVTCLPWAIRNRKAFGAPVLISANFGTNLLMGNHPGAEGGYNREYLNQVIAKEFLEGLSFVERDQTFKKMAVDFIKSYPLEYLKICLNRVYITLKSESLAVYWNRVGITAVFGENAILWFKMLTNGAYYLLLFFCFYSIYYRVERQDAVIFVVVALLAVPFIFIVGGPRLHLSLIPYLILFACQGKRDHRKICAETLK